VQLSDQCLGFVASRGDYATRHVLGKPAHASSPFVLGQHRPRGRRIDREVRRRRSASPLPRRSPRWRTIAQNPACAGVCVMLEEEAIDAELARLPLPDIWGIAGRLARRKQTEARFVRERFSVTLEHRVRELQGIPCIALEDTRQQPGRC
jgi:hypothetical protein